MQSFDSLNGTFAIDELDFSHQLHMLENNEEGFNFINPSNFCSNPDQPNMTTTADEFNHCFPPTFPTIAMEDSPLTQHIHHTKFCSYQNTKKRPRVSKHAPSPKKHSNGGENIGSDSLGCSRTSSLEDDDVSQNTNNRKTRGLATDPQSQYARKRREKINERLRILQNLVPNGTKVDISTMLEEAVQYVKFLQLQIKVLSSDDLWMYAPIAYNDKNIWKLVDMKPGKEAGALRYVC